MKKRIFTCIWLCTVAIVSRAQQLPAFSDALQLAHSASTVSGVRRVPLSDTNLMTIARYLPSDVVKTDKSAVFAKLQENPLLKSAFQEPSPDSPIKGQLALPSSSAIQSFLGSAANADVTKYADGLAKFLAERAKEELEITFFSRLQKALEKYPDFKLLFPNTVETLELIDEEIYDFKRYVSMIREAFYVDINNLPQNLPGWLEKGTLLENVNPDVKAVIVYGLALADAARKGKHPAEMLDDLSKQLAKSKSTEKASNMATAIHAANAVSQSMRSNGADHYWVPLDSVRHADKITWQIYAGLMYQQYVANAPTSNDPAAQAVEKFLENIIRGKNVDLGELDSFQVAVTALATSFGTAEAAFKNLKEVDDKSELPQALTTCTSASLDVLSSVANLGKLVGIETNGLDTIVAYGEDVEEIMNALNAKQYSFVVAQLAIMVKKISGEKGSEFGDILFKYGSFLALLLEAEDSDDVQSAIELYALPSGSSRVKKESSWNIALQSYVGVFGQFKADDSLSNLHLAGDNFGVTAPVGIAFSKGFPMFKSRSSITLNLSLIDVGALVHYRLVNPDDSLRSKITLGSIVSPGAGLMWGIPTVPISIGATYSMGPLLTGITADGEGITAANNTWGLRFVAAVDIPLLNLFNATEKVKTCKCKD